MDFFARTLNTKNKHLRVLIYINIRLTSLQFSLKKEINLSFFSNNGFVTILA